MFFRLSSLCLFNNNRTSKCCFSKAFLFTFVMSHVCYCSIMDMNSVLFLLPLSLCWILWNPFQNSIVSSFFEQFSIHAYCSASLPLLLFFVYDFYFHIWVNIYETTKMEGRNFVIVCECTKVEHHFLNLLFLNHNAHSPSKCTDKRKGRVGIGVIPVQGTQKKNKKDKRFSASGFPFKRLKGDPVL